MDVAYDHIQEEILTPEQVAAKRGSTENGQEATNLNTEIRDAYKSFSATPWGAKLGGFFSDVKKSSTTFYDEARSEAGVMSGEAVKGFSDLKESLVMRARSMSAGQGSEGQQPADVLKGDKNEEEAQDLAQKKALNESDGMISRFKSEAAKRLKDLEKAEEAADAAIFRFGANIGNFLKDAVSVAPPTDEKNKDGSSKVLFESRDQDGKRVIHGTRFEAQLHAVHTSYDKFTKDPESDEYGKWKEEFDTDKKTADIAQDLGRYDELRKTMGHLVPEKVQYNDFWCRYYFLRMIVESDEARRKELLKGASQATEDQVLWDDDSDTDQDDEPTKPKSPTTTNTTTSKISPGSPASFSTIKETTAATTGSTTTTKPVSTETSRRSQDENSDASYDLVSGATSRAPGSPKVGGAVAGAVRVKSPNEEEGEGEEEEEDWE